MPVDSLSRWPASSMVTGRTACLVAANGAPDCKAGADKLCQSKGYKEGKSLDTDAAEKCSPKVYHPRPQARAGRLQDRKLRDPRAVPVAWIRRQRSVKTQYLTLERLPCWYDVRHL